MIEQDGGDEAARRAVEARVVEGARWRKVAERRGLSVFLEAARPPRYRHLPSVAGALIGDVFDAQAAREGRGEELDLLGFGADTDDIAWRLVERGYGRFVAILTDADGPARVLRDPLGAMDALGWRREGMRIVASRLPEDLPWLWPQDLAIDWEALAAILRQKNLASHICPLKGVTSYEPGVLSGPDGGGVRLWSPERFAGRTEPKADPVDLRRRLDGVVAAWAQGREGIFCEISGGLDSAIVACSLARTGAPPRFAINHGFPQAEADERRHAQVIADHIKVPLVVVDREHLLLDPDKFVAGAGGPRPNYVGGDPDYDADLARRLGEPGVEAVFTGRGGDAVLYQTAHPALVRDVLLGRSDLSRARGLEILARRSQLTVWTVLRRGLAARDLRAGAGLQSILAADVATAPAALHPWLLAAKDLDPARQVQILGIVNGLSAFRESARHRVGDVIDPWMSQPIVEFCLSVPPGRLAVDWHDRPFARRAFADRLPPQALARRGKGNLATYFARSVAESLDLLRPFLLDGELAGAGLLDRERLAATLTPDHLIWSGVTAEIFILVAIEAWAACWTKRLARRAAGSEPAASTV